jgi:hypothetical protein
MATLVEGLLPLINDTRQLAADLGARPYRVFVRVSSWDGGSPFVGNQTDEDTELLPRPRISEVAGDGSVFAQKALSGGLVLTGRLRISGINPMTDYKTLVPDCGPHQRSYFVVVGADGGQINEQLYTLDEGPFRHLTKWSVGVIKTEN